MNPQPYAPALGSGRSISLNLMSQAKQSLDYEVQLNESPKERDLHESCAEIYSIITVLNSVEKAYVKGFIEDRQDYNEAISQLLNQYSVILKDDQVSRHFESLDAFMHKYQIDAPLAKSRIQVGIPATLEHSSGIQPFRAVSGSTHASHRAVAETTGNFITCMDAIKLNYKSKEQLHPLLSDLIKSASRTLSNQDFTGRSKLVNWLITLNNLKMDQLLTDSDCKSLLSDLQGAYTGFIDCLE